MAKKGAASGAKSKGAQGNGGAQGFVFGDRTVTPDAFSKFTKAQRMADTGIPMGATPLEPIPKPRMIPPVMALADVLPAATLSSYKKYITFHSAGDSGGINEPSHQFLVADKMVEDLAHPTAAARPAFFYHLGDVVYYFGQDNYYHEQFYDPYRDYAAPIFAIPGNHDGVVYKGGPASLAAFLKHFCSARPTHSDQALGAARTTMTQPGVYFTLNAPFVKIIGLYSNTQDQNGAGVIAGGVVGQDQKNFLIAQLKDAATERGRGFQGAVILAVHHPPFTGSHSHNPSPDMLQDIDQACEAAQFRPDVVLSGHSHLYERYTRYIDNRQVPFVVAGMGGYFNLIGLRPRHGSLTPRPPVKLKDRSGNVVVLENYNDRTFGFLRLTVSAEVLSCEFVGVSDQASPGQTLDRFTLDLNTKKLTAFRSPAAGT